MDVEIAADVDDMDVDASDKGSNESSDECDDGEDDDDDDDEEGLPDELDALSMEEMTRLKDSVKPIRLVLTKVSRINKHQQPSTPIFYSFEVFRSLSRTPLLLSFPSGTKYLIISLSSIG